LIAVISVNIFDLYNWVSNESEDRKIGARHRNSPPISELHTTENVEPAPMTEEEIDQMRYENRLRREASKNYLEEQLAKIKNRAP